MKKITCFIICCLFVCSSFAQNNASSSDDFGRIALSTYIDKDKTKIPNTAYNVLQNKLNSIVTQNGLGSSQSQRFIITANCNLLTKDITATAPPMHAYTLEITFYIGDGIDGTLFSTHTITSKGVGETEDKAYLAALKAVKTNNPDFKQFLDEGKNKIIEYYNSQCDFLITKAKSQASMENYDEALYQLINIPEVCKDCFMKAQSEIEGIYRSKINKECIMQLNKARAAWVPRGNADDTRAAAMEASEMLAAINPYSNCYDEALELMKQIGKKMEEIDKREWEFLKQMESNRHEEELNAIKATKEIAIAQAKNQPKTVYKIYSWW